MHGRDPERFEIKHFVKKINFPPMLSIKLGYSLHEIYCHFFYVYHMKHVSEQTFKEKVKCMGLDVSYTTYKKCLQKHKQATKLYSNKCL